jgi:hypothetical protein
MANPPSGFTVIKSQNDLSHKTDVQSFETRRKSKHHADRDQCARSKGFLSGEVLTAGDGQLQNCKSTIKKQKGDTSPCRLLNPFTDITALS